MLVILQRVDKMRLLKSAPALSFLAMWLFIGLVSAYDAYLVERYSESIVDMEENPVGQYLLEIDNGGTSLLIRTKAGGTAIVLCILVLLYTRCRRIALPVVKSIAAFQFCLLMYLTIGVPETVIAEEEWATPTAAEVEMDLLLEEAVEWQEADDTWFFRVNP